MTFHLHIPLFSLGGDNTGDNKSTEIRDRCELNLGLKIFMLTLERELGCLALCVLLKKCIVA